MTLVELPGGFLLPLEWVISIIAIFIVFFILIIALFFLYLRKGDTGPEEEDLLALIPVDEHETIQRGDLIGGCERTEDELIFDNPKWQDEEGQQYQGTVDITQKVPIPLKDASGREKRLWIARDRGHIDVVSASTIVSEKIPKRWDLPLLDPRRIFRHLEGSKTGSSITNALTTKTGIITVAGIFFFGVMTAISSLLLAGYHH